MHKKSTLLSVSIFFLLFIGVSDYGYGCHRPGSTDGGGCGKVDGGGSKPLKVHLAGAFVFGDQTAEHGVLGVVLNEKGNTARSAEDVHMTRPDDGDILEDTWDGVFATCPVLVKLLDGRLVESIWVGDDDWRISINTGEIRLKFPHMELDADDVDSEGESMITEVDLDLQLIGDLNLNEGFFPPDPGFPIEIPLDRFDIRGSTVQGIHPRERCGLNIMSFSPLLSPILTICADEDPECPPLP